MPKKHSDKLTAPERRPAAMLGLQSHETRLIAMMLAIKALVFLYAGQSYQVLANQRIEGVYGWLELWNRWDALNYQKLAVHGYNAVGDMRPTMVFYPLFPWTIRCLAVV